MPKVKTQGDPRHEQKTDEIYMKLETHKLFKIKHISMGRDIKKKEVFGIFLQWKTSNDWYCPPPTTQLLKKPVKLQSSVPGNTGIAFASWGCHGQSEVVTCTSFWCRQASSL